MKGPDPSTCGGYWSPVMAAGPQSALSAVLAGFVFTAITVVLTTSPHRSTEARENPIQRSYALQLFASAFIILALDSYFTSITAGELACNRAYAESALSGGILGDGAILMITGLGWLITTYSVPVKNIGTILSYINWGIWAVVIIMLSISAIDVGQAMLPKQSNAIVNYGPIIIGILMAIGVVAVERRSRAMSPHLIEQSVRYAALSGLGAAVFAGLFTGVASAFGAKWWTNPPSPAVYVVIIGSMLVPAVPLITSIPPSTAARSVALRPDDGSASDDPTEAPKVTTYRRTESPLLTQHLAETSQTAEAPPVPSSGGGDGPVVGPASPR